MGERIGGRQKGTPNKATVARETEIKASGQTPLEFLIGVMRDETREDPVRIDAAKAAAPFVHPKLAAIEHTGKDGGPIETVDHSPRDLAKALLFALSGGKP